MSNCNLSTYEQYPVKQVLFDNHTGKYVVKLLNPPSTCQDGNLVNGRTIVKENADVPKTVLTYSTQLKAPVVLMKRGEAVVQVRDPSETPTTSNGLGFFGWVLVIAVVAMIVYIIRKVFRSSEPTECYTTPPPSRTRREYTHSETPQAPSQTPSASQGATPPPSGPTSQGHYEHTAPPASHTTVINNGSGGGAGDFALGMMAGSMLGGGHHTDRETIIREREVVREVEREPAREERYESSQPTTYSSDSQSSQDDDDEEEDSGSSYSSDSGSSYSSDDSSSYSSDSGSDYSSDSGSSDSFSSDS